jgi:hypothetical protein
VAVSVVILIVTRSGESEAFETQYEGAAQKLIDSFSEVVIKMGAISGLGVAFAAHTGTSESTWPYVTLPYFHQRALNVRDTSGALFVSISPLVPEGNLEEWNNWTQSTAENEWMDLGFAYQEVRGDKDVETTQNVETSALYRGSKVDPVHYFGNDGKPILEDGTGPYLPTWQTSPIMKTHFVNENMYRKTNVSVPQEEVAGLVLEEEYAVLGGFTAAAPGTAQDPNQRTAFFAALRSIAEGREGKQGPPSFGMR